MNIFKKLRYVWHEVFYFFAKKSGVEFALRCRNVAEEIDLKNSKSNFLYKFRFHLHLSLCQPCKNYYDTSRQFRLVARKLIKRNNEISQIEQLNKELIKKYINRGAE